VSILLYYLITTTVLTYERRLGDYNIVPFYVWKQYAQFFFVNKVYFNDRGIYLDHVFKRYCSRLIETSTLIFHLSTQLNITKTFFSILQSSRLLYDDTYALVYSSNSIAFGLFVQFLNLIST